MRTVLLIGTLDTKGTEYAFIRDRLHQAGVDTIVLDTGVLGAPAGTADFDSDAVAHAGGSTLSALREAPDRGDAIVLCHGGPIADAEDAQYILSRTKGVAGFFGASSVERLPTEVAITENVRKLKEIHV